MMRRWPIRYLRSEYSGPLVRAVERGGARHELRIQRRGQQWGELVDVHHHAEWVPSPGARACTVEEYIGTDARRIKRYGEWIEISGEAARSDGALLTWCQRHANSELPSGAFRLPPGEWMRHSGDALALPFLPEFDHPDEAIRQLAGVEAARRALELQLQRATDMRREAIATATSAGYSRRSLGCLIGLSYARIQQLLGGT